MTEFFLRGLLLGVAIAAPVGPIGVLCIRRTLAGGLKAGFVSGMGTATADALYGLTAAFGLSTVSRILVGWHTALRMGGGFFLLVLAVSTWKTSPAKDSAAPTPLGGAFFSALFLTLSNPMTILSFVAVFAGAGLAAPGHSPLAGSILVAGVFTGSLAWWLTLSSLVHVLRHRLSSGILRRLHQGAALILGGFGLSAWAQAGGWLP